jgi:hypothetical protein
MRTSWNPPIIVWVDPRSWPRRWRGADCGRAGATARPGRRRRTCHSWCAPRRKLSLGTTCGSRKGGREISSAVIQAVAMGAAVMVADWPPASLLAPHCHRRSGSGALSHVVTSAPRRGGRWSRPYSRALAEAMPRPRAGAAERPARRHPIVRLTLLTSYLRCRQSHRPLPGRDAFPSLAHTCWSAIVWSCDGFAHGGVGLDVLHPVVIHDAEIPL